MVGTTASQVVLRVRCGVTSQGVFYGCKYAIPAMRRAGGGSIINTASFVAILGAATPQVLSPRPFVVQAMPSAGC